MGSSLPAPTVALQDFMRKLQSGNIQVPLTAADAMPTDKSQWPDQIVWNKKVLLTTYDPETNVLSLKSSGS